MAKIREDLVHVAVRRFLRASAWRLIAGQYPNGSDDELPPLNIMDPLLARDDSPDHRRHSKNKFVPDLVAYQSSVMLVIEMKPAYSFPDEQKLITLLSQRRNDLISSLNNLQRLRRLEFDQPIEEITFVPSLAFGASSKYQAKPDFCYFRVVDLSNVIFDGNSLVPSLKR